MNMDKKLIILIGNSGSGKTEIAKSLNKKGFKHIQIDDFFPKVKRIKKNVPFQKEKQKYFHRAYIMMFNEIQKQFKKRKSVVIDTTGVNIEWRWINKKLNKISKIKIYRIFLKAPIKVLKERIKKRNKKSIQIKVDMDFIDFIAKRIKKAKSKFDYIVNANQPKKIVISDILKILKE